MLIILMTNQRIGLYNIKEQNLKPIKLHYKYQGVFR